MASLLLKGGRVIDGTGASAFEADVLVTDGVITAVGPELRCDEAEILDVTGQVVAPGFIDTHSHSDLDVLLRPQVLPKIMQGITTELLGQDGVSMAPLPKQYISPWRKNLAGLDGDTDQIDWGYENTKNYLNMIEAAHPGLNEMYLVPHGNIRMEAMGLDNRLPTDEEIEKMRQITRREMEAGAFGLSTGLIYIPCAYSESKEIIEMCKVVAEYDGVFVIHQRSEADTILDSMKEVIEIGRKSGVKVHWSHFKVCGKQNWDKIDAVLELLEQAKAEGITVSFDQYPYVAGSTMMGAILPPWVHDGGTDKAVARLADPELRKRMAHDMEHGIPGWDNFVDFAGFENIFVTSVKTEKNVDAVGLSIVELAQKRGVDTYTAAFDLLMEEENAVGMVDFYGTEEHVKRFMCRPEMNVCTDGLMCPGKPHPRLYGSFVRVLGKYVREEKAMTLEQAVYKMTGKPAQVFSLKDRGQIKPGFRGDITVFDPETVADQGTFTDPIQFPRGIAYVLVNGQIAVNHGTHTGALNGQVIRHYNRKRNVNSMNTAIKTEKASAAIGPYSQAIQGGNTIYVSGQLPIDPATGAFPQGGIQQQTRQSLTNMKAILEAAGAGMDKVVKTTVLLKNIADFAAMNEVYAEFFAEPFPARAAFQVAALPKDALVEIECVAVL